MPPAKIVIAQVDSAITTALESLVSSGEYAVHVAETGDRVLEIVRMGPAPDLVIIDHRLRDPDALETIRALRSQSKLMALPILFVAPAATTQQELDAVQAGSDDVLTQPFTPGLLPARVKSLLRLKFLSDAQDDAENVLHALARTLEAKDPYTLGHADRVSQYAFELGRSLGVNSADAEILRKGGMLHDIGKIAIPDSILLKPGRFTPEEFDVMKRHPVLGCDICQKLRSVRDALPLIRHHHEKLDGTGYPDGLKGDNVPPLVRVVTIVDIYDALRSQRAYKEAFSLEKSFTIMWEEVEKGWWDKTVLAAWEKIVRSK